MPFASLDVEPASPPRARAGAGPGTRRSPGVGSRAAAASPRRRDDEFALTSHGAVGTNVPAHSSGSDEMASHRQYAPHDVVALPVHALPHTLSQLVPGMQSSSQNHSASNAPHADARYTLSSSYPRRTFKLGADGAEDEDLRLTFEEAGLCPRAALFLADADA